MYELALPEPVLGDRCGLRRFVTEDVGPFGAFLEDEEATRYLPFPRSSARQMAPGD